MPDFHVSGVLRWTMDSKKYVNLASGVWCTPQPGYIPEEHPVYERGPCAHAQEHVMTVVSMQPERKGGMNLLS